MEVLLVDHMGSDLSVANAARVSFAKRNTTFDDKKDTKLINYLAKHNHWSPFGHASMQFYIKAPVFVARQLVKHQIGLTWNEVSRRYVDIEPEFYTPEVWRGVAENKKQGSSDIEIDINPPNLKSYSSGSSSSEKYSAEYFRDDYQRALQTAKWTYEQLLKKGVAPEQARMVLPQSMITEWYWSGTLYAFARVCNLRCKDDAQKETQNVGWDIDKCARKLFPASWQALRDA